MAKYVFLVLCVVAGISRVFTQEKRSCLTEEVINEAIGCITKKFEGLLNDTGATASNWYSASSSRHGRHLQSVDDTIYAPRVGNKAKAIKQFNELHGEVFKDLTAAMAYLKDNFGKDFDILNEVELITKLSKINVKKLQKVYGQRVVHDLLDYKDAITRRLRELSTYDSRLGDLWDLLCTVMPELCPFANCMKKYNETQFEDGLDWVECLFECDDLPDIAMCVNDTFSNCKDEGLLGNPAWISNLVVKGFADFAKLDQCYIKLISEEDVKLDEGGKTELIFKTYLPPIMQCYDLSNLDTPMGLIGLIVGYVSRPEGQQWCFPEIQISTSNYLQDLVPFLPPFDIGSAKCRSDKFIHQAAVGWHENAVNNSCTIVLTNENWNDTFTVPLAGVVDGKVDGEYTSGSPITQSNSLTLKVVVNGEARYSRKLKMEIADKDTKKPHTCRSFSDPHIVTFDGVYYNNHFEGYFQLYKHKEHPYQVQAIYQRCGESGNGNGTCTCAVAVQSGDDVIVIDKCRRKSLTCGDITPCVAPTGIRVYLNGELTNGTRLYRRDDGLSFDILLPHGTYIQVTTVSGSLNAFIRPSVNDRDNTEGMCGIFNENENDDLTLRDGTKYQRNETSETAGQPKDFTNNWRVAAEEVIFWGTLETNWTGPGNYCTCQHLLLEGVQCHCSPNVLVEACDMTLGEEITGEVNVLAARSWRQLEQDNPHQKLPNDDIILNNNYDLMEVAWKSMNESHAFNYCTKLIDQDPFVRKCLDSANDIDLGYTKRYIQACVEDAQLTDTFEYGQSAVQAARGYCQEFLDQRFRWTNESIKVFTDLDCPSSCNGHGNCVAGRCECTVNTTWTGPACGHVTGAMPIITLPSADYCDDRNFNCSHAHLYGANFLPQYNIRCHLKNLQVGVHGSFVDSSVEAIIVSPDQIACPLHIPGSYRLTISFTKTNTLAVDETSTLNSQSVDFVKFDSTCYTCNLTTQTCTERTDRQHCLIDDQCLAVGQAKSDDECYVCDPAHSETSYKYKDDSVCKKRIDDENSKTNERNIRIILACSLSAGVVLVALVLFLCTRGHKKEKSEKTSAGYVNKVMQGSETVTSFTTLPPAPVTTDAQLNNVDPAPMYHSVVGPEQSQGSNIPPDTRELAEFIRLKEAVMAGSRSRTSSTGSRKSLGMGAAGPMAYGQFARDMMNTHAPEPEVMQQVMPQMPPVISDQAHEYSNIRL